MDTLYKQIINYESKPDRKHKFFTLYNIVNKIEKCKQNVQCFEVVKEKYTMSFHKLLLADITDIFMRNNVIYT